MAVSLTQKQIEAIEDLPLSALDRWYVLLVALGEKRGGWLGLQSDVWREGDPELSVPEAQIQAVSKTLESLAINFKVNRRVAKAGLFQPDENSGRRRRFNQLIDIFIAQNQTDADDLSAAFEVMDHAKLGELLGYPATAVAAFGQPNTLSRSMISDCPPELENARQHTYFMLSREHWREELEVVRRWLDVLDQHSQIIRIELNRRGDK